MHQTKHNLVRSTAALTGTLLLCLGMAKVAASPAYQRYAGAAEEAEVLAGYRALFTCSAHFHGGRSLQDILQVELVDTRYANLPDPVIDTTNQLVSATDAQGHTMHAVYRPSMGCTLLPPHIPLSERHHLPTVSYPAAPDVRNAPFPVGDKNPHKPVRALSALLNAALDGSTYGAQTVTNGVIVLRGERILGETYANGFDLHTSYRTWSTAKSITATLIGIAEKQGLLNRSQTAPIPEWQYLNDPRSAITLQQLMWMSSGLESFGANTNAIYFGGQDAVSAATGTRLLHAPNTVWQYANNDTLLLARALKTVIADDTRYLRYPYDELFHKLGMYHSRLETDHQGNFISSSQMYTTPRDLARFGLLYLNNGRWNGEQLLPEDWSAFVASPAPAFKRQPGQRGYGAQFWLLGGVEGLPADTYTTAGNKGQYVTIIPSENLLVVRTGVDPNGVRWLHEKFVSDVLTTLQK